MQKKNMPLEIHKYINVFLFTANKLCIREKRLSALLVLASDGVLYKNGINSFRPIFFHEILFDRTFIFTEIHLANRFGLNIFFF